LFSPRSLPRSVPLLFSAQQSRGPDADMEKDFLTLKRAPIGPNEEDYDVLFNGVLVGRIVLSPSAPNDRQWMWSLDHRDRSPTFGYEPTREAAMAAFAKSWRW
jgi:hypothetical protein